MPTIKTVFVLEDQVSPALNNIGNTGDAVLSNIENAAAAVNAVMNNTAESTSQTAVSLSELSTAGSELASQSRSIADVLEAEAQKAQNSASKYRERADQMASAADYARKYHESLKNEMFQTDNLTEAMKENAQAALEEAERLEKAAKAADKKAVKAEKAAESAERMSEAAQKEAQAALEEAERLEKAAEESEKKASKTEKLAKSAEKTAEASEKAAQANLEEAEGLEKAAAEAEKKASKTEKLAESAEKTAEASEKAAQANLEEAESLEKAAEESEKKASKTEKLAESAEKTAEASEKAAQANLEEAESLEKAAEAAEKTAQAEEQLSDSAGMVVSEENKAANALDKSEKEAEEYSEAMTKAAGESEKLGEKGTGAITDLKDVIVNAGIVMGLKKIGDAFLECSRSAAEFESGIAKVSTIADTSRVSLSTIEADIMSLSRKTGQSAGDITEASYQAMSASVDTASAVQFVDEANKLAVGGFTQQATAADVLTTAINAYGLQVAEATRLSDMLIMTQNLGKTTVDELAQNMGRVIPLASAYNVEMDNVSAAYAEMTKNGIATAESTTYIKSMLNELGSSGSEVSKVLTEQTGQSFAQLMQDGYSLGDVLQVLGQSVDGNTTAFNNLWGSQEAGIGALSLFNSGAAAFNGTLREMQGSAGATEKAYSAMTDTTEFASQRMSNSFSNLKLTVGGQLNPVMEELYNKTADIVDSFTGFADEHPGVVAGLTAVGTGLTVATLAVTGFTVVTKLSTLAVKAFTSVMNANPVFALASGVITLVSAVSAFSEVMEGNSGVEDYTGTMGECRTEIEATEEKYKAICETYGANSSAAKALAGELDTLNAQYVKGGGVLADYGQKAAEAEEELRQTQDSIRESYDAIANTQNGGMTAISMLESLSNKSQKTNADLDMMSQYADYLNDTFNCNIEVDYDTGKLTGFDPADASSLILDARNEAKRQTAMDFLTSADEQNKYIDNLKKLQQAKQDYAELEKEIQKASTDLSYVNDSGRDIWDEYENLPEEIERLQNIVNKNSETFREQAAVIDETGETYNILMESLESAAEAEDEATEKAQEHTEVLSAEEQGAQAATEVLSGMSDEILELCGAYDEAYNSAYESFKGQFGLFDEAKAQADATVENAQAAQDSQLQYWTQYGENIELLSQTSAESLGVTQENYNALMEHLRSGDQEAAGLTQSVVDHIENGEKEAVAALANTYGEVDSKQKEVAANTAEWTTDFNNKLQDCVDEATNKVSNDLNLSAEARASGVNTINAYAQAIQNQKSSAVSAAQSVVDSVRAVFDKSNITYTVPEGTSSSSKVGPQPYDIKRGYASGTLSAEPGVALVGEEGPELVMFRGGETVYTADETERIIKGNSDRPLYVPPGESGTAQSDNQPGAVPCRKIELEINGKGKIEMKSGTDKNEVVKIMQENLKPVLYEIVSEEFFEEGDYAYEY